MAKTEFDHLVLESVFRMRFSAVFAILFSPLGFAFADDGHWKKHIVDQDAHTMTAIAGDFTGDGLPDVITDNRQKTQLFVAPDWKPVTLFEHKETKWFIHSECFDIDGDGDLDYVGARYNPGLIIWLEQPSEGAKGRWRDRLVDDTVHGIHGLMKADVDGDGKVDLLATSAQDKPPHNESLAWFSVPDQPLSAERWKANIFADKDAPGLTHYLGVGDINGDGRMDAATGAKGGANATSTGEWFAWWESPVDPSQAWTKHLISDQEPGATNIHPADVNGDGKLDFIASRGHGRGVVWFEAPSWQRHDIDADIKEPHCLAAVDMDGDGDIDAATCAFGDKIAAWYENDGSGNFTRRVVGTDQESYDIRAFDMDVDGDLDLLVAGRGSKNVVWYENPK
ncbi:FG-GAP repeat domain-containing protein [Stieleria marina]|uniref:FG-GAP repeat protein n=1 Tax=Stieleria marina TaxID=1930275 RepID=A0A517P2D3_9BACT|nr:FG-GAP repeat protein [Planctomycetes bacterium K23_9]